MELLVYLYIITISWSGAISIQGIFTITNILVLLITIIFYFRLIINKEKVNISVLKIEDIFLVFFIFNIFISYIIKGGNFNYTIAYSYVFIFIYLNMKLILFNNYSLKKLLKVNYYGVLLVCLFVLIESTYMNIFKINIREVLSLNTVSTALFNRKVYRAYGLSLEPTNLGMYLITLGPIAMDYIKCTNCSNMIKIGSIVIFFLSIILTFSSSAFAILLIVSGIILVVISISTIMKPDFSISKFNIIRLILILIVLILIYILFSKNIEDLIGFLKPIIKKINIMEQVNVSGSRFYRWINDIYLLKDNYLLGIGPGKTTILKGGSSVNWYLNILIEQGFINLINILIFQILVLRRVINSKLSLKDIYLYLFSILSGILYLLTLSTFYEGYYWLLLSFLYLKIERRCIGENTIHN